jgi:hypothetical protein
MTDKLCTKYKKQKHKEFGGFDLWKECLAGNKKAFDSMRTYNVYDILSLEELYSKLAPWDNSINMNVFYDTHDTVCNACGSTKFQKAGFRYTNTGKFQRLKCTDCGQESRVKANELSKEKKETLKG